MILSDKTILELNPPEEEIIQPFNKENVQPASYDLRLGKSFLIPKKQTITMNEPIKYNGSYGDYYILKPNEFVLATTEEYIKLPDDIAGFVQGRSSIGRIGLFVQNAGFVDPGFEGELTLELFNASPSPIVLEPGRRIAQLVFIKLDKPCLNPYNGKYIRQKGAMGSRIYKDQEVK